MQHDHPRYRVFLAVRTDIGLGLCCEEAARLLLSRTEKVTLRGAVSKAPPRETVELLLFRQKLLDAAQDRRLTLGGRMRKILALAIFVRYAIWANRVNKISQQDLRVPYEHNESCL